MGLGSSNLRRLWLVTGVIACLLTIAVPSGARQSAGTHTCAGKHATFPVTDRGQEIRATPRADVIQTAGGRDSVDARQGDDLVCLGAGHDEGFLGKGEDVGFGGPGEDRDRRRRTG